MEGETLKKKVKNHFILNRISVLLLESNLEKKTDVKRAVSFPSEKRKHNDTKHPLNNCRYNCR